MIRLLVLLLMTILFLTFVLYNLQQTVVLKYMMGLSTGPLPVYLVILVSLVAGMILASLLTVPSWFRNKMEIHRQRKMIHHMEQEIDRLADRNPDVTKPSKPVYADDLEES